MRLPSRVTLIVSLATLAFGLSAPIAQAGVDPGLCHSTTARADIPSNFAVNACFDGSHLILEDSVNYVLQVKAVGDIGAPKRTETDIGLAADATRLYTHGNAGIVLPGDTLSFPIGLGAGKVGFTGAPDNGFYATATTIAAFFPGGPAAIVGAFTGLVAELNGDDDEYKNCIIGKNWLGQLGCQAQRSWNVSYAVGRAVVNGVASDVVAAVLAPPEWTKWVNATAEQAKPLKYASKDITIPAAAAQPTTTTQKAVTSIPTTSAPISTGASFSSMCVVAWPTAPTITSRSIQMTMSCNAVPENEYLFTVVTYGDPNLPICPDHPDADVVGTITGTARSAYGFKELLVQASNVTVQGHCDS